MSKPKMTINQIAAAKARHALRLKRKSALPATRSCIVGRSFPAVDAPPEMPEDVTEESAENECTN